MKKLTVIIMVLMGLNTFAAINIGYIDTQEITAKYTKMQEIQKRLIAKKTEMEKELETEKKKIEKKEMSMMSVVAKPSEKEKNELAVIKKEYNTKALNYEKKLQDLQISELNAVKLEIEKACKTVATSKKLDTIVDKAAVLYGAVDVTDDVIKVLNKK